MRGCSTPPIDHKKSSANYSKKKKNGDGQNPWLTAPQPESTGT